jgi:hypothetical protein
LSSFSGDPSCLVPFQVALSHSLRPTANKSISSYSNQLADIGCLQSSLEQTAEARWLMCSVNRRKEGMPRNSNDRRSERLDKADTKTGDIAQHLPDQ